MDSLGSLLQRQPLPEEPAEVRLIKHYVSEQFNSTCQVQIREHDLVVQVRSSALANAIRLRLPELKRVCGTDKRISVRIAST